jgi:S-DNA-T family DNA segregation ATPase FtsK/SpoIIIE
MEYEVTVADRTGFPVPLLVEAEPEATVGALREALTRALAHPARGPLFLDGRPLPDSGQLAGTLPVAGARLALGTWSAEPPTAPPAEAPAHPRTERELAVVGGLCAGAGVPLRDTGALVLGRSPDCGLVLPDVEVSRRHAGVRVTGSGAVAVDDRGSRNGTALRGVRITGSTPLTDGEVLRLGETMVALRRCAPAGGALTLDPVHGVRWFNRPPRIVPPRRHPEVVVPPEPDEPRGFRFPLAMVLLPLLLAGILYAVLPNAGYYLIFLAFAPLMAIAHAITERRGGRREYKTKLREYHAELAGVRTTLDRLATAEERATREALPDPAALARIATGPTGRLFERRPADDDFGRLRVGLTDRPVEVRASGPALDLPTVYAVPVAVDLVGAGVLGVAGPRRAVVPIARALVAQAATLHAPHDLGLVLITGRDEAADWDWAAWLPHTLPHRADLSCRRMVATDRVQAEARVAELTRAAAERRGEQRAGLRDRPPPGRRLLVVLDGARRLRDLPGLADLLAGGPSVGIHALCLDASEPDLPDECRATVVATCASGSRIRVSVPNSDTLDDVLADGLTAPVAERIARALAPIRVLGARFGGDSGVPDRVRYLDLAGLPAEPTADDVLAGWAARPDGRDTEVLLGADAAGPVRVDLRRDGPHALIAGTSGAGKSELLQTLVAALALGNTPDALHLVLVDYKGGSAFAACRDLPHCVGLVTDLDGHLADRALASLAAELRRREAILAAAGAKDIEDYWAAGQYHGPRAGVASEEERSDGGEAAPRRPWGPRERSERQHHGLARLVIVIDEFATLVEEVPEFVSGVVGIGMRGRSLGVHVVLATQRPGGVVNAEIRANVNLRLCLRVTRAEESSDVVDAPDASRISRLYPGRAYLRTGHGDLSVFQCARIGWPRTPAVTASAVDAIRVAGRRFTDLGRPRPGDAAQPVPGPESGHAGETDLTALVTAVRAAADRRWPGAATAASPWLPPLPEVVTLADLADPADPADPPVAVPLGLADHPASQAQRPYVLDLDRTGPVAIAGMARSGRSTALRTLAASLAARSSPADVHLYALDYGGRALAPLAALPHCGACVDGDDPDRTERLLDLLTTEVTRRAGLLATGGYGSLREQRAATPPPRRLPYWVVLIDRYETFLARHADVDGGRLVDILDALLRRGPSVGIHVVLATDRSGFTSRLRGAVATRLALRQADADDLALFGVDRRGVPRSMPPGRAFAVPDGVEVQVALLAPDPDGAAQAAAVERLGAELAARWDGVGPDRSPRRVDPMPSSITATELARLRTVPLPDTPAVCTVGAGGDHLAPVDVDLAAAGSAFLVSGAPRSGRSTALAAIVTSLSGRVTGHLSVLICCPRPSPLAALAGLPGVLRVLHGNDFDVELQEAVDAAPGPVAVVVDDAELIGESPAGDTLDRITRCVRDSGNLVIAAGTTDDLLPQRYRGWLAAMRRGRCGLLLNPSSYVDGEVFDVKLPRSTRGGWPPGRALLIERGATAAVQVTV